MSENYTQTVAAVSTPHGRGGVAMIRISGPDSAEIIDRVFVPAGKASPADAPRRAVYGRIVSGRRPSIQEYVRFSPLPHPIRARTWRRSPATAEFTLPRRCFEAVSAAGAPPQRREEFTRRVHFGKALRFRRLRRSECSIDADTAESLACILCRARTSVRRRHRSRRYDIRRAVSALCRDRLPR